MFGGKPMVLCAGCEKPIFDRYLHHVIDKDWHAGCLTCVDCKALLSEKCFSREGRLYCRSDFLKRYGTKCSGCQRIIQMTDLVRRAREKIFHVDCFRCMTCQKQLSTGEELYIINGCKFLCKSDYLSSRHPFAASNVSLSDEEEADDDELLVGEDVLGAGGGFLSLQAKSELLPASQLSNRSGDQSISSPESLSSSQQNSSKSAQMAGGDENGAGASQQGAKRRGPRTTIKAKQLETLKAAFAATPKPTRHIREKLAQETGLNMRVIQVWFQNRRSKERRMKQLRYGGFRPGSRRSRNALMRDDPNPMIGAPMFADGLRRRPDAYYPSNYYCDIFPPAAGAGAPDHNGSPTHMNIPPSGFMMTHPEDSVVQLDSHNAGDAHFILEEQALRKNLSPGGANMLSIAGLGPPDERFRGHHEFGGAILPSNINQEPSMATW